MPQFLKTTLTFVAILCFSTSQGQDIKPDMHNQPYTQQWKEIDSLQNQGLYQSALDKSAELYQLATAADQPAHIIKALIYQERYIRQLEEEGDWKALLFLENSVNEQNGFTKAVLQSILGQLFYQYYSQNRWQISQRTPREEEPNEDVTTWTSRDLIEHSTELYMASVEETSTRNIAIKDFEALIDKGEETDHLMPTVYDVLIYRATQHFSGNRSLLGQFYRPIALQNPVLLRDLSAFLNETFSITESPSAEERIILLFQEILSWHHQNNNEAALLDLDLRRLQLFHNISSIENKNNLYEQVLSNYLEKYKNTTLEKEILLAQMTFYYTKGAKYHDPVAHADNRWTWKKAYEIGQDIIARFPDSYAAKQVAHKSANLLYPRFSHQTEQVCLPGQHGLVSVSYQNTQTAFFKIIKLEESDYLTANKDEVWLREILRRHAVQKWQENLPETEDLRSHSTETSFRPLPAGIYLLVSANNSEFEDEAGIVNWSEFQVAKIGAFSVKRDNGVFSMITMDRNTGVPLPGVNVTTYLKQRNSQNWMKGATVRSDAHGKVVLPSIEPRTEFQLHLKYGRDAIFENYGYYYAHQSYQSPNKTRRTNFFTDRSIYRPGQPIHFKAIVSDQNREQSSEIVPNQKVIITFKDVNQQEIDRLELTTNAYGAVSGTFTAPQGVLLGTMSLSADQGNASHRIRVEEYKRPQFAVEVDPLKGTPKLNDEVKVTGSAVAFAGPALQSVQVNYEVRRSEYHPWRRWSGRPTQGGEILVSGETQTDEKGAFEINFIAAEKPNTQKGYYPNYAFTVSATVVDVTGESRTGSSSFYLSKNPYVLNLNIPSTIDRSTALKAEVSCMNLANQPATATGTVVIERLDSPDQTFISRYWQKPDQRIMTERQFKRHFPDLAYEEEDQPEQWKVAETLQEEPLTIDSSAVINKDISTWFTGHYRIKIITVTDDGDTLAVQQEFELIDEKEGNYASIAPFLIQPQKTSYEPGSQAQIKLITPDGSGYFYMEVAKQDKLLDEEWLVTGPSTMFSFPVQETHRGGFAITVLHIRKNRSHSQTIPVQVPWTNKQLNISYETFRDKLYPDQEEEWVIKIDGPNKDQVAAELLAGMYDASLDEIKPHSWFLSPFGNTTRSNYHWQNQRFGSTGSRVLSHLNWDVPSVTRRTYPSLRDLGYAERNFLQVRSKMARSAAPAGLSSEELPQEYSMNMASGAGEMDAIMILDPVTYEESADESGGSINDGLPNQTPPNTVRKNLQETAFFFPHLQTDDEGRVVLKFRTPESLTKWRLMLLSHTKDFAFALSENEMTTQKELMVQPNAPRFLREGDRMNFTAKVSNLSDSSFSGHATLEFFDLNTDEIINGKMNLANARIPFTLEPATSEGLSWSIAVPQELVGVIGYRVKATAGQFSDGEESALPVLSNQILLTETLALFARSDETTNFELPHLRNANDDTKHQSLTLEMTTNPVWVAVKALPYLMEYPHDCTEQLVNRLFANSVATHIVEQHPQIEEIFQKWQQDGSALESPLMQNQSLKSAILEETPWVLEAQDESKQRQRIARLFDSELMQNEATVALDRLKRRQNNNGSFSWFPGGPDSWYITQYVLEDLVRLKALDISLPNQSEVEGITISALDFCRIKVAEYYQRLLANEVDMDENHLYHTILHFIYIDAHFTDIPSTEKTTAALDYFKNSVKKHWTSLGLYEQGMMATAFHHYDDSTIAKTIIASLRERARRSDELGMYWKYNEGYRWNQRPLETHAMLMETFHLLGATKTELDEMTLWLLRNKETNRWETTKATSSAIFAILQLGNASLLNTGEVQVSFPRAKASLYKDELEAVQQSAEAGTGYYKLAIDKEKIEDGFGAVRIKNKSTNPVWGGLYWQYFETLDQIQPFEGTPLKIERQIYKVVTSAEGQELEEIIDSPSPGDLLRVRLVLRTDRDMEFLHLKDLRASGLEPTQQLSGYQYQDGLGYYQSTTDVGTHFFFDQLPKGDYVLEYDLQVFYEGDFSGGLATLQCMYAPKFSSHSAGGRLKVGE